MDAEIQSSERRERAGEYSKPLYTDIRQITTAETTHVQRSSQTVSVRDKPLGRRAIILCSARPSAVMEMAGIGPMSVLVNKCK